MVAGKQSCIQHGAPSCRAPFMIRKIEESGRTLDATTARDQRWQVERGRWEEVKCFNTVGGGQYDGPWEN